jgi:hypothetical protein
MPTSATRTDLVAVDVDVASAAARSVGHGAGVAAEDAGDGAGVGSLFFVKSGELRRVEAEGGHGGTRAIQPKTRPSSAHSGACPALGQSAAPAVRACMPPLRRAGSCSHAPTHAPEFPAEIVSAAHSAGDGEEECAGGNCRVHLTGTGDWEAVREQGAGSKRRIYCIPMYHGDAWGRDKEGTPRPYFFLLYLERRE